MNEPPDQTAELSAANLLSSGGMILPKYSRTRSGMLADGRVGVGEEDALLAEVFLQRAVDDFALELGLHAGEELLLGLGNAEPVERVLDLLRHVVPGLALARRSASGSSRCPGSRCRCRRPSWASASTRRSSSASSRKSRIHAGSFFISEICATIVGVQPACAALNTSCDRRDEVVLVDLADGGVCRAGR